MSDDMTNKETGYTSPIDFALMPLKKYADFNGRSQRSEYWWYVLFTSIVSAVLTVLDIFLGLAVVSDPITGQVVVGALSTIFSLAIFVPSLAVAIRRLHDIGKSGWWWLIILIPLAGVIVFLVFMCSDSQVGDNKYGPDPKADQRDKA